MQKLLIVIDMQNDFVGGVLGSVAAKSTVPLIVKKIQAHRAGGGPILFTLDTHADADYAEQATPSQEAARIPRHCVKGTNGWRLVDELLPFATAENMVEKPSFLSVDLQEHIRCVPDEIELCGVCTDICVVSNALALRAHYPKARIVVDPLCCAGTTPENHEAALRVMQSCLIDVKEES